MFPIARYVARRRRRGSVVLTVLLSALGGMTVGFYPSIEQAGADFEAYMESLPPAVREAFGVTSLTTVEGFMATEFYQFALVVLMGMYAAYAGGRLVAAEVETTRIDFTLAAPVSRDRVVVERYLSLLPTFVLLNLVVPAVVYGSLLAIDETIAVRRLAMVHALSIPYLLACAGIGLGLSVVTKRADVAQRGGLGVVFALFIVESIAAATDYGWVGRVSPTHYYDPTAILVEAEYAYVDAGVLLAASVVLVGLAVAWFRRVDVSD